MSQERLFGRSLLCYPILKFSHSTLPRSASPSGWSHIQAPDLHVLIERLQDEEDIRLRIVQGTNDLEVLPLTRLIQETKDLHRRYPGQSPDSLPIFGLTKGTALAIRYFCQNDQVRRIQLRFDNESSCNDAVQILYRHGLMFSRQTGTSSQPRPATSESFRPFSAPAVHTDTRGFSSITVPTVQDAFHSNSPYLAQPAEQQASGQHSTSDFTPFTSSPDPRGGSGRSESIQRQPTFSPIRTSEEPYERPATTSSIQWPSDMVRDILPPRRELPFPRPSTASSSSSKMLPPLPKPTYASDKSAVSTENKGNQGHVASAKQSPERKRVLRLETPRGPTRFEPPTARMYNFHVNERDSGLENPSPASHHDSEAMHMDERPTFSSSTYCSSPGTVPQSPERQSTSSPLQVPSPDVEMTVPVDHDRSDGRDGLRRYAEQSKETRRETLNKFVMDVLDSDDFLTLCVDAEAWWRRRVLDRRE